MADIAFLGTGLLGAAFAQAAAQRGDSVTAWNRSPHKVQALAQFGVKAAATAADAVRGASRVHLVLKDDAVVDAVIAAARDGLAPDAIVFDHSTTLPVFTAERMHRLNSQGIQYLHCPVFMGPAAARNAQGWMMASGPKPLFDSASAALAAMTGRLQYMGERADLAAVNKLFGNAMIIGMSAVVADVLTLAQACGVPAQDAITLLSALDLNAMVAGRGANMAKGDFTPSFELAMASKDVQLMLETAGERPMAVLPGIKARMETLIAAGHGAQDASVLGIDAVKRS